MNWSQTRQTRALLPIDLVRMATILSIEQTNKRVFLKRLGEHYKAHREKYNK